MATYIVLANFTEHGIQNVKETTRRADAFKDLAKMFGITVKDIYWSLGRYDIVTTVEAPDEKAFAALGLSLGKSGNIRTETLRAFSQSEMAEILDKVV
jgi:uncharacterized protein with GYD domain